ncbi:MAG TPA: HDOD domain-containing protein [Candidatus Didemnitutus sp.]
MSRIGAWRSRVNCPGRKFALKVVGAPSIKSLYPSAHPVITRWVSPLYPMISTLSSKTEADIRRRIDGCPKLASLQSNNQALSELVKSDQSLTSQIADIIRHDPSLSARLLRMVNSVYFGLSARVNSIEEAVFFLGLRQIRELSMATPIIEELERVQSKSSHPLPWRELWSHSIGTAILTREILHSTPLAIDDDTDYLVGLLHNVGKVVMAYSFPDELHEVMQGSHRTSLEVCEHERSLIGWDHAQIGAYFLERHQLADEINIAVQYHNAPDLAPRHGLFAAAVQVADMMVRHAGISGGFEKVDPVKNDTWLETEGWKILYGTNGAEAALARAHMANTMQHLPSMLGGVL